MGARRRQSESVNGVPRELLDENHARWGGRLLPHREAAEAFAIEQGWVQFYGSNESAFIDLNRLRAAGVPMYACARLRREKQDNTKLRGN